MFVPTARVDEVNFALTPLGVGALESDDDRLAPERDGQCRLWWGRTPVDLFFSYDEVHKAMREGARRVLHHLVGDDDPRKQRFDDLLRELRDP